MTANLGTITIELHVVTKHGGPITLGEATIDVPMTMAPTPGGATLTINQAALRHEIANALIDAANQIDQPPQG